MAKIASLNSRLFSEAIIWSIVDEAEARLIAGRDHDRVKKEAAIGLTQLVAQANKHGCEISWWTEESMWSRIECYFTSVECLKRCLDEMQPKV